MVAEVGVFALALALALAALLTLFALTATARAMRVCAYLQFLVLGVSFGCLVAAFVLDDFSVAYVATNSNTQMPLIYKVSAAWGGHEGSLLLWVLMLAGWTAAFAYCAGIRKSHPTKEQKPKPNGASDAADLMSAEEQKLNSVGDANLIRTQEQEFKAASAADLMSAEEQKLNSGGDANLISAQEQEFKGASAGAGVVVLGVLNFCFIWFTLATSNPFARLALVAAEGRELNPLLQDIGLALHPPMLYMGYVGFSVAFALAVAALARGRADAQWARQARAWAAAAWIFLTVGIALGSWWAYYELGWGGWWFWDPVENASFMPWLSGTALLHSLAATAARGVFRAWSVLLAILTFSLCLLGTFIVRSGVLVSVHAFASDPQRGVVILIFLAVVVGVALGLFALRAHTFAAADGARAGLLSRDGALLMNNVFLGTALVTVLLGTLYPLVLDAVGGGKISVGPPYYNRVFVPLMLPLLALVGAGAYARWKRDSLARLMRRLSPAAALALAVGAAAPMLMAWYSAAAALAVALAAWIFFASARTILDFAAAGRAPALTVWAMVCAHIGLAVFVVGAAMATIYGVEKDVRLAVGESYELGGYRFRLAAVDERRVANYRTQFGVVEVERGGGVVVVHPEKRYYASQEQPLTEAGIDAGLWRDIYVSLGEELRAAGGGEGAQQSAAPAQSEAELPSNFRRGVQTPHYAGAASSPPMAEWSVRLQVKPLMRWVWGGALLMALGAALGVVGRRRKLAGVAAAGR